MRKSGYLYLLINLLFLCVVYFRLIDLNILNHQQYLKKYRSKTTVFLYGNSAPRGRIIDCNGKVIVDNKGIKTIVYNKIKGIKKSTEIKTALKLATILDVPEGNIQELKNYYLVTHDLGKNLITKEEYELLAKRKLTPNDIIEIKQNRITKKMLAKFTSIEKKSAYIYNKMNKGYSYDKKIIKDNVSEKEYALVLEENIPGITGEITWQRKYNYGDVLRSILGSIGNIPKEKAFFYLKKGYQLTDKVGLSYLEEYYEDYLKGSKAKYKVNNDNTLTLVKEAKRGCDLILSIDLDLVLKIQEILKARMLEAKMKVNTEYYHDSYVLVSNPFDGRIIALQGLRYNDDKTFSDVTNNVISSSFVIGSAVKGATISVGYKNNLIDINKKILDGCVKLYLVPQKCSHKRLGRINDLDALAYSSNYYQYLIAINLVGKKYYPNMKLGATKKHFDIYRNTLASFGLGAKTGIDLFHEQIGLKGKILADDLLLNLAIGQYDTYTPVQVLQYINTISSGKRIALSLVKEIKEEEHIVMKKQPKVLNDVNLDNIYLERIRLGFKEVLRKGTGKFYVSPKIKAAGKTGTSESFYDSNQDGNNDIATISSTFAGYFPSDKPKFSVVVMTPNISHKNGKLDYMYFGASKITKDITNFLFENY